MNFAKVVFTGAGIWGIVVLAPLYFTYDLVGQWYPPAVTHPDFYYGFLAITVAWQVAFLIIGRDPVRLRALMIPAILEKFLYVMTLAVLYGQRRLQSGQFMPAAPDLILGCLFVAAYFKVRA